MNESPDHDEEVPASHLTSNNDEQSPGEILSEARRAHGYSIEDLCAQTKLAPRTVRALEDNDFGALSQPVFARGYYRQCAKVLDIDSERLMAAYSAWVGESPMPHTASPGAVGVIPQDVTPSHRRRGLGLIVLVLVLLVVVAAVFVFLPGTPLLDDNASADNAITVSEQPAPAVRDGTGTTVVDKPAGTDASTHSAESQAKAASANRPTGGRNVNDSLRMNMPPDTAGDAEAARGDAEAAPQVAPNHLKMTFHDRSWVDVRDADGARLLTGIYESGEKREFDATPPYKITLGRAPAVNISIGGKNVDIASQTVSNGTARLTIAARGN